MAAPPPCAPCVPRVHHCGRTGTPPAHAHAHHTHAHTYRAQDLTLHEWALVQIDLGEGGPLGWGGGGTREERAREGA